jgi:hypothetical protein
VGPIFDGMPDYGPNAGDRYEQLSNLPRISLITGLKKRKQHAYY